MICSRQLRVRPHNDDGSLLVVEVAEYGGDTLAPFPDDLVYDEVFEKDDLPEAVMRAVEHL